MAQVVRALYENDDSPLRYHINMLGGRSAQEMWINQAQVFGDVHKLIRRRDANHRFKDGRGFNKDRGYGFIRDVLKACKAAFGSAWGDNKDYMVTRDVTIKHCFAWSAMRRQRSTRPSIQAASCKRCSNCAFNHSAR